MKKDNKYSTVKKRIYQRVNQIMDCAVNLSSIHTNILIIIIKSLEKTLLSDNKHYGRQLSTFTAIGY